MPNSHTSFSSFLFQCRTEDPDHFEPRPVTKFDYVETFASLLEQQNRLIVVKSRQMMASWIGCAYILHRALTHGPGIHLVVSKEERSAKLLIERIQKLIEYFEGELPTDTIKPSKLGMAFPELGSRILSLPAAPFAVRGISPRTVFWDEMAFTPSDEEIWSAVKPAIDSGGSFLGVSTPNGPSNVFSRLVHSRDKEFYIHRMHYSENKDKDQKWEVGARAGLSDAKWRREYELSFEGAEGKVYDQFDNQVHVLEEEYIPGKPGGMLYRGIDFGYLKPAVVWAELDSEGRMVIFDSLVGNKWLISQLMVEIEAVDARYGLSEKDFVWSGVDPAGASGNDSGISSVEQMHEKGYKILYSPSSINAGVEVVRSMLLDANGEIKLKVSPRCSELITGFEGYVWAKNSELPEKDGIHDHVMDALRYLLVNLKRSSHPPPALTARVAGVPNL